VERNGALLEQSQILTVAVLVDGPGVARPLREQASGLAWRTLAWVAGMPR
jgi:hypothetical protein